MLNNTAENFARALPTHMQLMLCSLTSIPFIMNSLCTGLDLSWKRSDILWNRCSQLGVLRWLTRILVFCLGGGPLRITVMTLAFASEIGVCHCEDVDLMESLPQLLRLTRTGCDLRSAGTRLDPGSHVGDFTFV